MILYLDIETIPSTLDHTSIQVQQDGRLKDAEKIAKDIEEKQLDEWKKEALQVHKAQIVCISCLLVDELEESDITFVGPNERQLLTDFSGWLHSNCLGQFTLIAGHNIKSFDLPMLRTRAWKYDLSYLADFCKRDRFDKAIIDTMELWAGTSFGLKTSLSNIADFFGIENHKTNGVSSNIWQLAKEGKFVEIAEQCEKDVKLTRQVLNRMR
jgi:predicted PolB exonuclease-like 3'-5' exonuclease